MMAALNQTIGGSQEEIVAERFPDGCLSTRSVSTAPPIIISTFPRKATRKASG
jgi:hypothetical protein